MKLETKVKAFIRGKPLGDYTVELVGDKVKVRPTSDTGGWTWYLSTLLGLDKWGLSRVSDTLSLDWGQDWYVTGMIEVYREIIRRLTDGH